MRHRRMRRRQPRGGAADRLAAARLRGRDLLPHQREDFRRRGIGRAGVERRRRIIFEPELDRLRGRPVDHDRHQRQREIDAGGNAAAGDAVAVDADPRLGRYRAEGFEKIHRRPVRRRAIAPEQAGRAQHQRSRADRGDVFCAHRLPAQEVQHLRVIDHVVGAGAAGHADHVQLRAIRKGDGGRQRQHGVGRHRLDPFPDQMHLGAGHAGKHLHGTGEIELRHLRKYHETDLKRRGHGQSLSRF